MNLFRRLSIFTLYSVFALTCYGQDSVISYKLKLIKVNQLDFSQLPELDRYELSGFALSGDNNILCVDDNSNIISMIDTSGTQWEVRPIHRISNLPTINMLAPGYNGRKNNIEAIASKNGRIFVSLEENRNFTISEVIENKLKKVDIPFGALSANLETDNAGIEAIDYDSLCNRVYFADEASLVTHGQAYENPKIYFFEPRLSISIIGEYNVINEKDDISDMKLYGKHLYVLKRYSCTIEKWDTLSGKKVAYCSFKSLMFKDGRQKLYDRNSYGLAEALLIKNGRAWVGLDINKGKITKDFFNSNKAGIDQELNIDGDIASLTKHLEDSSKKPLVFVFELDSAF